MVLGHCFNYLTISDSWRKKGSRGGQIYCDKGNNYFNGNNWVRFKEPAGVKLPNTSLGDRVCETHVSGYIMGTDPTIVGQTLSRTACFGYNKVGCEGGSVNIKVSLCSDNNNEQFLVYQLRNPPTCHYAYCAESN